jgi:hypothetical protein
VNDESPDEWEGYEDEEHVPVPKESLMRALGGLLMRVHPYDAYDPWMSGMELLLNIDEDAALAEMGWLYRWEDAEAVVANVCAQLGLDPTDVKDHGACAGCGANVDRLQEACYMTTSETWAAAGDPKGMWCIGCLEERLGRQLRRDDFNWNIPFTADPSYPRSERLQSRLRADPDASGSDHSHPS